MADTESHPIFVQLKSAGSTSEQNDALRALKTHVIGHIQRKVQWVELGVLEPLAKVLGQERLRPRQSGEAGQGVTSDLKRPLDEEEQLHLHALELLAIFASGGPPFLSPLHAIGFLSLIVANISPVDNHPRLVLAALRALLNLAEASALAEPLSPYASPSLAEEIFVAPTLDALCAILSSTDESWDQVRLVNAVAKLISLLCKDERHQVALADSGVLDALATKLAGFIVADGYVIPDAMASARNLGLPDTVPAPASPGTSLVDILSAIAAIIADSRLRACMLLYSPSLLSILPDTELAGAGQDLPSTWSALDACGLAATRLQNFGAMDLLLPAAPAPHYRSVGSQPSSFPTLGMSRSKGNLAAYQHGASGRLDVKTAGWDNVLSDALGDLSDREVVEPECALIPWLFVLVRQTDGLERLMAASILTSLYKAGFAGWWREPALAMLVVPLLVQTLHTLAPELSPNASAWKGSEYSMTALTLTILARLVTDSEVLQKSAFDCDAIKVVGRLLKDSYEPLHSQAQPEPWKPSPEDAEVDSSMDTPNNSRALGPLGQYARHVYRAQLREGTLKAVAAIVSFKYEYRKPFIEEDAMPYIVESLVEKPTKPTKGKDRASAAKDAQLDPVYGHNPTSVLIAACHTVRMLSRSVSILRTALIDAGVAQPIFNLLRHPDLEVQVAATGTICNLVLEVSPMRDRLDELGVMKVLCEHAHSLHAPLRLNAVWALKHFVDGATPYAKKACVDELEPGWLVRLICDDTEDEALYARMKNEKQTQASKTEDEDVEMEQSEEDRRQDRKGWSTSQLQDAANFPETSHERTKTLRLRQMESRLAALREAELNPVRRARSDDLAIQEQGLDFIRNLLGPANSVNSTQQETTDMVDYLFSVVGQDRLFEILARKLQVKVLHPFGRRAGQSSRVLYPQPKIVEAVLYVLVHVAASVPQHRQLVMAQTELLKLLSGHFTSRDKNVRLALCHLVANLTWRDDTADGAASSQRAHELARLGVLSKIEQLAAGDAELDVREKAKVAKWQIAQGDGEY